MRIRLLFYGLIHFLVFAYLLSFQSLKDARADSAITLVLYDAASGVIPSSSLLNFTDFPPGSSSLTFTDGATVLDTTKSGRETYAGWVASQTTTPGFLILDPEMGFQVNFKLQVENETHSNHNRAGFSIIILDQDAKGVELAFWENEIWAQNDDRTGGLFTHGEGTHFASTSSLVDYQVTIAGDTYTLSTYSKPILSGPVRDYSNFDGFPDPYETQNFLFLGDDTPSSQARVRLGFVSVTGTEPVGTMAEIINTSTGIPIPAATLTPLPTFIPAPSPAPIPTGKPPALCPSGSIFLVVIFVSFMMVNKNRR